MEPAAISARPPVMTMAVELATPESRRERKGNRQPVRHSDYNVSNCFGSSEMSLDVQCLWHRFYPSFNCAMIVFKTRADWHMASVSCEFRSIRSTHSTPPWLRATGKLRQTSLMPQ
jgi:hypothetical protein